MKLKQIFFILLIAMFISSCATEITQVGDHQGLEVNDEFSDYGRTISLKSGWYIQSSAQINETPEQISDTAYVLDNWYKATVPSTILGNLVNDGIYTNIYFAKNFSKIDKSQFRTNWYYRREFNIEDPAAKTELSFEGINYSADIWLNGKQIASRDECSGAFSMFKYDISDTVRTGKNVLLVSVHPPKNGDFTIGFVDWTPEPRDKNMGIFREVKLHSNDLVSIHNSVVRTDVDEETLTSADVVIETTVRNNSTSAQIVNLQGVIEDITVTKSVELKAGESKTISFTPEVYPQLKFENPRLWWPSGYGEPNLYDLKMSALIESNIIDSKNITFGIREVSDYFTENGYRGYKINGKKILLRGAGWMDDLLLNEDPDNLEKQFQYVKHMNLNTVRLEGFWGTSQHLYDLADKYGILLMAGFSCQWEWEDYLGKYTDPDFGGILSKKDFEIVSDYLNDQVLWLRNHPSILVWVMGSDMLPKPELERRYLDILAKIDPTRPYLGACKSRDSIVSGPTGVKMEGPYDYVAPIYWYEDQYNGGAFGFNTETGPGPQIPPLESLKKMLPEDKLWPVNPVWNYHAAGGAFDNISIYKNAFDKRYGQASTVEEFAFKTQAANYEAMRAMFEAFGSEKPNTTGIIQWMLNGAWPKIVWQLYDYYLIPNGAFYGAKKANEPLVISYNYKEHAVYAVNNSLEEYSSSSVTVTIFDINSKVVFEKKVPFSLEANGAQKILDLPEISDVLNKEDNPTYFLNLKSEYTGKEQHNFYWLSTQKDGHAYQSSNWYVTPLRRFADFSGLKNMQAVSLESNVSIENSEDQGFITVQLTNPTNSIAFFTEVAALNPATNERLVPIFWDDNYISLLPNETRTLTASYSLDELDGAAPIIRLQSWNNISNF